GARSSPIAPRPTFRCGCRFGDLPEDRDVRRALRHRPEAARMKCPFPGTVEIEVADALEVDAPPWPLPSRAHVDGADGVDPAGNEEFAVRRQAVGHRVDADDPLANLKVRLWIVLLVRGGMGAVCPFVIVCPMAGCVIMPCGTSMDDAQARR